MGKVEVETIKCQRNSTNRSAIRNRINPLLRTELQAVHQHFQRAALEKGPSKKKRDARVHLDGAARQTSASANFGDGQGNRG